MSGINSNNKVVCLDESDDESDGVGEWREVKNKKKERIEKRHASRSGGNDVTVKKARTVSHGGGGAGKKSIRNTIYIRISNTICFFSNSTLQYSVCPFIY